MALYGDATPRCSICVENLGKYGGPSTLPCGEYLENPFLERATWRSITGSMSRSSQPLKPQVLLDLQ